MSDWSMNAIHDPTPLNEYCQLLYDSNHCKSAEAVIAIGLVRAKEMGSGSAKRTFPSARSIAPFMAQSDEARVGSRQLAN